jgi:hypothetical protein
MSNLTITDTDVSPVEILEAFTGPAAEQISAGCYVRLDTTSGKVARGNGSSSAEIGPGRNGVALKTVNANESVTVMEDGILDVGDALNALSFDDKVYASDTDGVLADSAGSVEHVVGTVTPGWAATTADKLLHVQKEA